MSGGRVELGIGAAWYDAEHTAYGIPSPDGERFERLEEELAILTGLWSAPDGVAFSFDGTITGWRTARPCPSRCSARAADHHRRMGPKRTRACRHLRRRVQPGFASAEDTAVQFEVVRGACRPRTASRAR